MSKVYSSQDFLEESSKLLNKNKIDVKSALELVNSFQQQRNENLQKDELKPNELYKKYFSNRLEQMLEKQTERELKIPEEMLAQKYTVATLIALDFYLKDNEADGLLYKEKVDELLNFEKKRSHKTTTLINDYVINSQVLMYEYEKLNKKERKIPNIEERLKEIRETQKDTRRYDDLSHPTLTTRKFEQSVKTLLVGESVNFSNLEYALNTIEKFQSDYLEIISNKISNPTDATEKMMPQVSELDKRKALNHWLWSDKSADLVLKSLMMVKSKTKQVNIFDFDEKIAILNEMGNSIKDIVIEMSIEESFDKIKMLDKVNKLINPTIEKKLKP